MEKLRKRLEEEEKRIAQAEAQAYKGKVDSSTEVGRTHMSNLRKENKKRKRSDNDGSDNAKTEDTGIAKPELQEATNIVPDPLTPTSQPALEDQERDSPAKALSADGAAGQSNSATQVEGDGTSFPGIALSVQDSSVSMCNSSSNFSSADSEDVTSSSGSSSDDDRDDDPPEEASTMRNGPDKVAPSKRARPKQICREFLHRGTCKRGSRCRYLHELPERGSNGSGSQVVNRAEGRKERVGLYQRVSGSAQRRISSSIRVLTICSCSL